MLAIHPFIHTCIIHSFTHSPITFDESEIDRRTSRQLENKDRGKRDEALVLYTVTSLLTTTEVITRVRGVDEGVVDEADARVIEVRMVGKESGMIEVISYFCVLIHLFSSPPPSTHSHRTDSSYLATLLAQIVR